MSINGRAMLQRNSGNTGWVVTILSASINAVGATCCINYKTS